MSSLEQRIHLCHLCWNSTQQVQSSGPVTRTNLFIAWWQSGDHCPMQVTWPWPLPLTWLNSLCPSIFLVSLLNLSWIWGPEQAEHRGGGNWKVSPKARRHKIQEEVTGSHEPVVDNHHTWQREAMGTSLKRTTKSNFCPLRGCWPFFHLESWWRGWWAWVSLSVHCLDV